MAVFSVLPPFLVFPGADGMPLENGYIHIGQPGFEARTTPKASFFDTAQTIPTGTASGSAIRTMGGFPVRNGSPSMFYVDGDFSISVLDRNGVLIYSALNTTLAVNLGGDTGPVLGPDGNLAGVGLGFINEVNTGWVRSATGTVQYVVQGAVVAQMTATGVVFNQTVSGAGFSAGVLAIAQPLDATLTALAGLDTSTGLVAQTGTDTFTKRTITSTGGSISVTNPGGVAGNINLEANTAIQWQTAISVTSGTSTNLSTTIPANVSEIFVRFRGAQLTTGDNIRLRIGPSGGLVTSGYIGGSAIAGGGVAFTTGFGLALSSLARIGAGLMRLQKTDTNIWTYTMVGFDTGGNNEISGYGEVDAAGTVSQAQISVTGGAFAGTGTWQIGWR